MTKDYSHLSDDRQNAAIQLYELDRRYPLELVYRGKARWYSPREAENIVEQLEGQLKLYREGRLPIHGYPISDEMA
jgi:CRISPR/Cas system CMR-associated protein Cmr1 (group 7 of RAMP superfamily)|tara:strand:+ start:84 stop:311 length:228 start_codon:yes stop_codon:yes gene_type:complete